MEQRGVKIRSGAQGHVLMSRPAELAQVLSCLPLHSKPEVGMQLVGSQPKGGTGDAPNRAIAMPVAEAVFPAQLQRYLGLAGTW